MKREKDRRERMETNRDEEQSRASKNSKERRIERKREEDR